MTIIAFNRYWVIRWPWLLVNLLAFMLLLGLSYWQWQRAAEKTKTLARIAYSEQQGPIRISELSTLAYKDRDGANLDFTARWLSPMVWLIDNQMVEGRIGYDVLIAVKDKSASAEAGALLVNLGWIAAPPQRELLPEVVIPEQFRVQGIFRTRTQGILLGTNIENRGVWPMRIQQVNSELLAGYLDEPLISGLLYQQNTSPFLIHYRPVILPPERHKAYALQWLLLAIALVVIALVASAKKYPQGIEP